MPLAPGTRLGPYDIVAVIGKGGMGEVYQARDTKLGRDVALKVLPDVFAADPDRALRFEREARTLASLNHPNIAAIYGVEESARALVMELVPGDDLAARLRRGALPIDDALSIGHQIAVALEAAHDQGIIHRDLKPANIKVRADGMVKVLDFGLAKAMGADAIADESDNANSPTLTHQGLLREASGEPGTKLGVILGTAAYMAPEQARGRAVDRRADIWAFGCVLFEMITGRRAFEGEDLSTTLAEVIKGDAPIAALPDNLPPSVRRLIARCLVKDSKRRLQAIGDARVDLEDAMSAGDSGMTVALASSGVASDAIRRRRLRVAWATALVALAALGALTLWTAPWRAADRQPVVTLAAEVGADVTLVTTTGPAAILSPDGRRLVFVGKANDGPPYLYVRRLDEMQATRLENTEGAVDPFFSPRGDWIGYFSSGQMKKVRVTGGPSVVVSQAFAAAPRGGTWLSDDSIVYTPHAVGGTRLMRVPASGGEVVPLGDFAPNEVTQRWPQALPGSKAILYTGHTNVDDFDGATIMAMPVGGGAPKVVHKGGHLARYMPSGHLLFLQAGTLYSMPFDVSALETRGEPESVVSGVLASPTNGGGQYDVSDSGTLIYVAGAVTTGAVTLSWVTRGGSAEPLLPTPIDWLALEFSPDGSQLALQVADGRQQDIIVHDVANGTMRRLTTAPTDEVSPIWSPNGRFLVYTAVDQAAGGKSRMYAQRADGGGQPALLLESDTWIGASSFHPDGKTLVYGAVQRVQGPSPDVDLMLLPIETADPDTLKAGPPRIFRKTPRVEGVARFSPDGRWIAYACDEGKSGDYEVFVEPYPGPGGRWQVSAGNALWPVWSRTRPELIYQSLTGGIVAVPYMASGDSFRADRPRPWTKVPVVARSVLNSYAIHPDGERVAGQIFDPASQSGPKLVRFVFNVFEKLKSRELR